MIRSARAPLLGPVLATAIAVSASVAASPGGDRQALVVAAAAPTSAPVPPPPCAMTRPDGSAPSGDFLGEGGYGNRALWTNLWMWGEDGVPVPPSHVQADGSLGPMKWAWYRYAAGALSVEGRRLDGPAPPLRARVPAGYGDSGFQVVGIVFPTAGCWQVTGRVGDARLTFVTLVSRAGPDGTMPASA